MCRAVAGLEGTSQQAQQRNCAVRRTFASSLAAVKRKAPCSQIKLQMVSGVLFPQGGGLPARLQGELSRHTSSELPSGPEGTGSQPPRSTEEETKAQGSTVTRPSLRPKPQLLGFT